LFRRTEHLKNYLILVKHKRGISVIIAGAGGAAHLPGMVASMSPLPVIGVPVKSTYRWLGFGFVNTSNWWCSCSNSLTEPKMLEFLLHKS
jgi:NCAIR mutase (PurE)-related protein